MSIRLPEYYKQWVKTIDVSKPVLYRGQLWHIYGEDELEDNVLIAHSTVKVCDQLYAYIKELVEISRAPITLEHSKRCVTIAHCQGQLLYFDITKHQQLFGYTLSSGAIEALGELQNFVQEAQPHS